MRRLDRTVGIHLFSKVEQPDRGRPLAPALIAKTSLDLDGQPRVSMQAHRVVPSDVIRAAALVLEAVRDFASPAPGLDVCSSLSYAPVGLTVLISA